eukprot:3302619-Rhodomonas_salina.2
MYAVKSAGSFAAPQTKHTGFGMKPGKDKKDMMIKELFVVLLLAYEHSNMLFLCTMHHGYLIFAGRTGNLSNMRCQALT